MINVQGPFHSPRFGAIDVFRNEAQADDKAFEYVCAGESRIKSTTLTKIELGNPNKTYWLVLSGDDVDHYKARQAIEDETWGQRFDEIEDPGNIRERMRTAVKAYMLLEE